MSFVNLCYAAPGKMTRKKVDIVLTSSLANVRVEAAQLAGKPKEEIVILHQVNINHSFTSSVPRLVSFEY